MAQKLIINAATGEAVVEQMTDAELDAITETPTDRYERLLAEAQRNRAAAYASEADPIFFRSQRGEATLEEWTDKITEIRTRYPDPEPADA